MFKGYRALFFSLLIFSGLFYSQARACSHEQAHVIEKVHSTHHAQQSDSHSHVKRHPEKSDIPDDCDGGGCRTHCCANIAFITKPVQVFITDVSADSLPPCRLEKPAIGPFLDGPFQPPRA